MIPVLLYVPFVQDFAVSVATGELKKQTGMDIEVGRLRLKFPLSLTVDDVSVVQANADTMLTASHASASLKLLPLLKLDLDIESVELDSAFYQLGNADSLMWLRARIEHGVISGAGMSLKQNSINFNRAAIDGADVWLRILEDTTETPVDTAASTPYLIKAGLITMSRVRYVMNMMPLIDSLGCTIDNATLRNATVDLGSRIITGQSLGIDSVAAAYIYPEPELTADAPADTSTVAPTPESEMWTITADTLRLTGRKALYAMKGVRPMAGFDPSYIEASDIAIEVDSFYNRGTSITVPLRKFQATERCGLQLYADGLFSMDGKGMTAKKFTIETLRSSLRFDAYMGMEGSLATDPSLPLSLVANGRIVPADVAQAFPAMKAMLAPFGPATFSTDIDGTAGLLNIYSLNISMPSIARLKATGTVENIFDPENAGGDISVDGQLNALTDKQLAFLPIARTPALALHSDIDYRPGEVSGDLEVKTSGGRVAADGRWTARTEDYDALVSLDNFPVDEFMPELGVGRVSAKVSVDGRGYNPLSRSTSIDADARIGSVVYNRKHYSDIAMKVALHAGEATGNLVSHNPGADLTADFTALLRNDSVSYDLKGNLADIDLRALGLSDSVNGGHATLTSEGYYVIPSSAMDITASVGNLYWRLPGMTIMPGHPVDLSLKSAQGGTNASLTNGDMNLLFHSPDKLMAFVDSLTPAMAEITKETDSMRIDVRRLNAVLPRFALSAEMGADNVASQILAASDMRVKHLNASIANDSLISMHAGAIGFVTGSTRLDTISFNALQHNDWLVYRATVNNRPGTFDDFAHVNINGFAGFNRASVFMSQKNIRGERGFNIGVNASIADSVVKVRLVPRKPVIAYKTWQLNDSNFISFDLADKHIDADLSLSNGDSFVKIFTEAHHDSTSVVHNHSGQEDLIVQISEVALQDWLSINPFAPPVKGDLSADMRFRYEKPTLTGKGMVNLTDLYYGRERVGTFGLDVDVKNTAGGTLMADVALMVDSVRTITAHGALNDSTQTSPFLLDFDMIKFPLRVANPFLPEGTATLSGTLNGSMKISGDMAAPIFDGYLQFDSAAARVTMLGTSFKFSDVQIPVDSNVVSFNDFAITGCNANPLTIDGTVDARHISDILLDLSMRARDIQIVNSTRPRGADVYGKAFINLDAQAKGSLSLLRVNADLSLLEGTNVTYVIPDAEQTLTGHADEDMVQFVQFSDTTQIEKDDSVAPAGMALLLNADLHFNPGSTINVDLSAGSSDKAQILPSGDLNFTMSPLNGMRMTGRLDINSGYVRYHPPVISEVNFKFDDNSYVAFNGDVLNPLLNIHAVEVRKANVTQTGQNSRLVDFDISVAITNSLENMNVAFDLATNDDITVQNELSSMSPDQRANKAMNLLLYNTYTGAGTKATASLGGNPLYSFLTSQINNWAANNIKGVDLSFGIDQYDKTMDGSTSTATSYNYRLSKTMFNDRFKIVVGGNYSTDANSDENFSQNLINDISFEYMLNKSGSMYVRIFRHTGYESILEGEITQTGVSFVLKRKLNSLWELFGIRRD